MMKAHISWPTPPTYITFLLEQLRVGYMCVQDQEETQAT